MLFAVQYTYEHEKRPRFRVKIVTLVLCAWGCVTLR